MSALFQNFGKGKKSDQTPEQFYATCVQEFHRVAQSYGVAKKGVITVPELLKAGEKLTLAFLNDGFLKQEYSNNPAMFYYAVLMFCFDAGIATANKWHKDFASLDSYVEILTVLGPADDANKLLQEHFHPKVSENQGNGFVGEIFDKWLELTKPYHNLQDPRKYYYSAMLAGYQVGVSMMLEKFGL